MRRKSHIKKSLPKIALIIGMLLFSIAGIASHLAYSQTTTSTNVQGALLNTICQVYYALNSVVFILALTLFTLGGVMYATANLLPGSQRGGIQGYAMGMIMGSIIGLIIVVAAPFVLNLVVTTGTSASAITNTGITNIGTAAGIASICSGSNTGTTPNGGNTGTFSCTGPDGNGNYDCTCSGGGQSGECISAGSAASGSCDPSNYEGSGDYC